MKYDDSDLRKRFEGKQYVFEDGDVLKVIQVKRRDTGPWVTYTTTQSGGLPRKLMLHFEEFIEHYGHLFE